MYIYICIQIWCDILWYDVYVYTHYYSKKYCSYSVYVYIYIYTYIYNCRHRVCQHTKNLHKVSPSRHPSLPAHSLPHKPRWWSPQGSQSPAEIKHSHSICNMHSSLKKDILPYTIGITLKLPFSWGKNTENPMDLGVTLFSNKPTCVPFHPIHISIWPIQQVPRRLALETLCLTTSQCHKLRPRREVCQQWFSQQIQMISWRSVR